MEHHPLLNQVDLIKFCQKNTIVFQAYSSLGTSNASSANKLMQNETIKRIASKHKITSAQVLLRWAVQNKICEKNNYINLNVCFKIANR